LERRFFEDALVDRIDDGEINRAGFRIERLETAIEQARRRATVECACARWWRRCSNQQAQRRRRESRGARLRTIRPPWQEFITINTPLL
jgi:hypothetical protein